MKNKKKKENKKNEKKDKKEKSFVSAFRGNVVGHQPRKDRYYDDDDVREGDYY